ncbi:hypothetical protein [Embleya scabrispora]|uniref:hypothetical protein n=1 Tax=Embleya scabrispora TaxID=159449 RepID=UPI0003740A5B|nr:hypothetical protein [Embleya scabrispora]
MRNPDYLADELLNDYESSGEASLLDHAGAILDSEEPEVRRYPMLHFLLENGRKVAREIESEEPVFCYYVNRVQLVLALADGLGGSGLKERRYLQREYAETAWGERIGSVSARAQERLAVLRGSGG